MQYEKKAVSNLKGMQNVAFEQTTTKVIGLFVLKEKLLYKKKQ